MSKLFFSFNYSDRGENAVRDIGGKCPYRSLTVYGDDGAVAMSVSARWAEIAARDNLTRGHRAPTKSAALMLVVDASTLSPGATFIHPIVSLSPILSFAAAASWDGSGVILESCCDIQCCWRGRTAPGDTLQGVTPE